MDAYSLQELADKVKVPQSLLKRYIAAGDVIEATLLPDGSIVVSADAVQDFMKRRHLAQLDVFQVMLLNNRQNIVPGLLAESTDISEEDLKQLGY